MKLVDNLNARYEQQREECLKANGWTYGMWRCYWVWRKQTHDANFVCLTAEQALDTEGVIQKTADLYEPKPSRTCGVPPSPAASSIDHAQRVGHLGTPEEWRERCRLFRARCSVEDCQDMARLRTYIEEGLLIVVRPAGVQEVPRG